MRRPDVIHIINVILGAAQGASDSDTHLALNELRRVFGVKLRRYKYEEQNEMLHDFLGGRHEDNFKRETLYDTPEKLTDLGRELLDKWYTYFVIQTFFLNFILRFNDKNLQHILPDGAGNKIRRVGVEPNLLLHLHFPCDPAYPGEKPAERSARQFANHPEFGAKLKALGQYVPGVMKMEAHRTKYSPWSVYSLPSSYGAHEQKKCLIHNLHQLAILWKKYGDPNKKL